jgi:hypothetical protein
MRSSIFLFLLFPILGISQNAKIKGIVKDAITGETIIGASVSISETKGTATDVDGNYSIDVSDGIYTVSVSYVGFEKNTKTVEVKGKDAFVEFLLNSTTLNEVEVVGDVARSRETPVAFSTVSSMKIEEQLASRDIPLILNTTPGVYATQQGGGDGDARINIRGFSQRNIAVMLDGIPVNDMENGWVYWSNWFGLDLVQRSIQVQRGLGASKLAIPSVGGTINILSKGIDSKRMLKISEEIGSDGFSRTSIGFSTGRLKNGWGIVGAASYKRGNGWVDQCYSRGWFYFLKVEKQWGNHTTSLSGMGAPQEHGQNPYKYSIATYSKDYAASLGIDTIGLTDYGYRFNQHWGYLNRYTLTDGGDTLHGKTEIMTETINYYHKPQFSLRDFWTVNDKLYVSNVLYLSIGTGGGTKMNNPIYDENNQIDFQTVYDANAYGPFSIDGVYSTTEHKSGTILRSSNNDHIWYGLLSTIQYNLSSKISLSGGTDLRSYRGKHYRTVYDLLGGDYYVEQGNLPTYDIYNPETAMRREGDTINYYNDGLVKWAGTFGQAEFKSGNWSAFMNVSGAYSFYKRIDYFKKMDLVLDDTTMLEALGYGDTLEYNGNTYTINSSEARFAQTDWKSIPSFTVKGGVNYNINEFNNVFFNVGYISKAPLFKNVIDNSNKFFRDIKNEKIKAVEAGYSIRYKKLNVNVNGYYTIWDNKPLDNGLTISIGGDTYTANVNGMGAIHKGVELDFNYQITKWMEWEGLVSLGDWRWNSSATAYVYDDDLNLVDSVSFDAQGVHVGDAAQQQFGTGLRFEPLKGLYIKAQFTYFAKYYADFSPFSLDGENGGQESWMIPDYYVLDAFAGYKFKFVGCLWDLKFNLLNALNNIYISDATNNDTYISPNYEDFDAKSASVFFAMGRKFTTSLTITF